MIASLISVSKIKGNYVFTCNRRIITNSRESLKTLLEDSIKEIISKKKIINVPKFLRNTSYKRRDVYVEEQVDDYVVGKCTELYEITEKIDEIIYENDVLCCDYIYICNLTNDIISVGNINHKCKRGLVSSESLTNEIIGYSNISLKDTKIVKGGGESISELKIGGTKGGILEEIIKPINIKIFIPFKARFESSNFRSKNILMGVIKL